MITNAAMKNGFTGGMIIDYTNSKKAIVRKNVDGEIFIRCGKDEKIVFLEFSGTFT